jgi:hypothetical protein
MILVNATIIVIDYNIDQLKGVNQTYKLMST